MLDSLTQEISLIHFSSKRVEEILADIYNINKNIVAKETELLRLAEKYGVKRQSFLEEYVGVVIDENWRKTKFRRRRNCPGKTLFRMNLQR